jgi:hypothetical protein
MKKSAFSTGKILRKQLQGKKIGFPQEKTSDLSKNFWLSIRSYGACSSPLHRAVGTACRRHRVKVTVLYNTVQSPPFKSDPQGVLLTRKFL